MTAASHFTQTQSKMLEHMQMKTLFIYWLRIYENDVNIISIIVIIYYTVEPFDNAIGIIIEFMTRNS